MDRVGEVEGFGGDAGPGVEQFGEQNAGRSQISLGFFQHYAADRAIGWSGGS